MRVIDLFQSLVFDWADSLSVEPISLQYLGSLNLQSCIGRDATGCEIVDRTTLLNLLSAAKRTVHAQGGVATSAQNDRLSSEISYILESCAIENHRRQVSHARVGGFEAWRRLLDLALMKCFDRLPAKEMEHRKESTTPWRLPNWRQYKARSSLNFCLTYRTFSFFFF